MLNLLCHSPASSARRAGLFYRHRWRWLAAGLLLLTPLVQAVTLDELQHRFQQQPVIRAHFEQLRTIKDLPQPLRSSGEMILSRHDGLLWQQTAPFPMTLILDQTRMVQSINRHPPDVVTAQNNPQLFQFNHLLRALFQADRQVLEQNFQLDFQDRGQGQWQLRLTPVSSPLNKLFADIELQGQQWVTHILIHDQLGDSTRIQFSQQTTSPPALTDDEKQRFSL